MVSGWLGDMICARDRYIEWARRHEPVGCNEEEWLRWREWYFARREYFDDAIGVMTIVRWERPV